MAEIDPEAEANRIPKVGGVDENGMTPEQLEEAKWYLAQIEAAQAPEEVKVDPEQSKRDFLALIDAFEAQHDIEALLQIAELDPKDAPSHPVREPARAALGPIVEAMKKLDSSSKEYKWLYYRYRRLSAAVGMINSGRVRHDEVEKVEDPDQEPGED